jgi:hypothetical protein
LIVVGLALIVLGLQQENFLWQAGLGAVGVAMLVSLATRWAPAAEEEEGTEADAESEDADTR